MPSKNLRITFAYLKIFFRRQFKNLTQDPLKPSPLNLGLMVFLLLVLVGGGIWHFQSQLFRPNLREGIIGLYEQNNYPNSVSNLLSQGLLTADQSDRIQPQLAQSITSNETGTQFIVTLKDNLFWVDKTPLRSSDLIFNFPGVQVSYPDNKTIQFNLDEAYTPFPSLLTKPVFKNNSLIGTGPYYLTSQKDVEKGPYPTRKLSLISTQANLPDLTIFMYPSENVAKTALKMGEIQAIYGVTSTDDLQNQPDFKTYSKLNRTQLVAIFYNTKDQILADENFRLALSFAAPSIVGEEEAKTTIPSSSWVFNPDVKDYLDNPTQAQNDLKKVQNGKNSTIILTTTNNLRSVGDQVVQAWAKEGINAKVKVESGVPQSFQALLIAQNIPADPDQYSLWHSTQTATNITKISNPRIDKDLEDGRKATDSAKRRTAYMDFQKTLLDHAPATPLFFPKTNVIYNKKVEAELIPVLNSQLTQP